MAATLWFSAGMLVASSFHVVRLAGRTEHLEKGLGAAAATRLITNSQTPAIAILTALVAATIICRVKPSTYLMLAPPTLVIALLAFARHTLLLMGVAGIVAFIASPGWAALRRTVLSSALSAGFFAVTIAGSLLLLKHSPGGAWLGDQFTAFNNRVLHNFSSSRLAMDPSILARVAENRNLKDAIDDAPVFGHGLGFKYQLPSGKPNSLEWTLGTTYAHNFYLWWLAKAGAVGMTAFAVFVLTPILRALVSMSAAAKIAAALSVALLVNCTVDPIPEDPSDAMVLGLALGAALQFAVVSRRARHAADDDEAPEAGPSDDDEAQEEARSSVIGVPALTGAAA